MTPLRDALVALCALAGLTPTARPARAQSPPHPISREGGPALTHCTKFKGAELTCPLPGDHHLRNSAGRDGSGMCVCTSIEMAARWQGMDDWIGFRDWCAARYAGGGWPKKVDQLITAYARAKGILIPPYVQYEGDDPETILRLADRTGRMACIGYGYSPRYATRSSAGHINHMVCCPKFSSLASVLDNNFPGPDRYEWQPTDELLRRMKLGADERARPVKVRAWIFVWLTPPPPPVPHN